MSTSGTPVRDDAPASARTTLRPDGASAPSGHGRAGHRDTGRGSRGRSGRRPPLLLVAAASLAGALALLPLLYLGVRALERGPAYAWDAVATDRTLELLVRSLGLAAVVVTACLVLGVSLAWLTVRTALPGARMWSVLATLPLAVPSYVAAFAWISAAPGLAGFPGAALALTLACYPYVYLPVTAALRGIDPAQEEAARSLGHGPLHTFRRVTLPQLRPAAAGGGLLVALYVLSDFGAVSIMRYDTFTLAIHTSYKASFDRTPAAALSVVLVVMTVLLVAAESRTRGRAGHARTGGGTARPAPPAPLGALRWPALGWCTAVAAAGVVFPLATL
ncbi:MAG TPA: ABC transporter permease subunit, partial [Streptomyces sp.]|nr:ABC transporter permease subunit [Streptomyces sp.]